jgi:EEF1A lysine methyltransferase 2
MEELNESKLGTKEYWDVSVVITKALYDVEIRNYADCGEQGEVWFGEDSVEKMIDWTTDNIPKDAKIIDIGMGNGHLCFNLLDGDYQTILGVDYSPQAVELANNIRHEYEGEGSLTFQVLDVLDSSQIDAIKPFTFALDKGTFDAISLAKFDAENSPANQYVNAVYELLAEGGILLITSCNWTETELLTRFGAKFELYDKVKYPVFQFGGVKGQTITTLAFKKK